MAATKLPARVQFSKNRVGGPVAPAYLCDYVDILAQSGGEHPPVAATEADAEVAGDSR